MIKIRPAAERGKSELSWLKSRFSFSFADYYDPDHMGFGVLRVINEDHIAPASGFGAHPHDNMEILTYVLAGALEHKDSMGNGSVIRPGDVQRMSAGTGVLHSEMNPSSEQEVHLLQIWILPERRGLQPGYEQKHFASEEKRGRLRLVASREGEAGSVALNQDVKLYAVLLDGDEAVEHAIEPGRDAWIQVARGEARLNGARLKAGDGVAVRGETPLVLDQGAGAELLLFDMAPNP